MNHLLTPTHAQLDSEISSFLTLHITPEPLPFQGTCMASLATGLALGVPTPAQANMQRSSNFSETAEERLVAKIDGLGASLQAGQEATSKRLEEVVISQAKISQRVDDLSQRLDGLAPAGAVSLA